MAEAKPTAEMVPLFVHTGAEGTARTKADRLRVRFPSKWISKSILKEPQSASAQSDAIEYLGVVQRVPQWHYDHYAK